MTNQKIETIALACEIANRFGHDINTCDFSIPVEYVLTVKFNTNDCIVIINFHRIDDYNVEIDFTVESDDYVVDSKDNNGGKAYEFVGPESIETIIADIDASITLCVELDDDDGE